MSQFEVTRYHDFSYGHRVVGHETKCKHLHGHNGRVHFTCTPAKRSKELGTGSMGLDKLGRVIDFGVIKDKLCTWLEDNWDHKFLVSKHDKMIISMLDDSTLMCNKDHRDFVESLVWLQFNPTAENLAKYLVDVIGPQQLEGTGVQLVHVKFEETAKCHASYGAR